MSKEKYQGNSEKNHKYWVGRWMDSLLGNRSLWVEETANIMRKE